jgi:periplasmic protein TonB
MFRVLTHRRKNPLTSPRFIAGSVIAHLWVALAVATVSRAAPAPEPEPPIIEIPILPESKPTPPPPAPRPTPPEAKRAPVVGPNVSVQPPTTVPKTITPEAPNTPAQDPDTGVGGHGDVKGTPPTDPPPPPAPGPIGGVDYVYEPDMVEVAPTLNNGVETGRLLQRFYPPVYADAGITGRTVVELIVDADGRVRPGSVRIVDSTHEQFADAARRVAERMRFRPAKVSNQPVPVLVQVPIDWRLAN